MDELDMDHHHFAERHGLILIIALGEAIIAVGVTLEGVSIDTSLSLQLAVGLAGVCGLRWAYFDRLQGVMESALRLADQHETGRIARDVYSLLHYPMVTGIVFYAVALEEAFLQSRRSDGTLSWPCSSSSRRVCTGLRRRWPRGGAGAPTCTNGWSASR